ncbi:SRPBCC family protein [Mucilaginibacter jinjuensis]|uniref:SRPBCC family protein n=1 Tax=Mucilaginibacter jinjuensis TaxID=1176721 RepID=A0ABY7TAM6_9SPHI|nr:SRPBCC family protein [Mucilaginibacter jinjuensis]WCT13559.1 SRPBCC family protein [Mucilaginibacter jinjuensis]
MPEIILQTFISAPAKVCFDLSLSIDLHKISTAHTNEEAIEGTTIGLIKLGEYVTWRARHFGIWFKMTSEITSLIPNESFIDEMLKGPFKSIKHTHTFEAQSCGTLMTDVFCFQSPFGVLGFIADKLILTAYLKKLLIDRNAVIKKYAENGDKSLIV